MAIQWYPGHMHKAKKEIMDILPRVDMIIEVLDARIPYSSENPLIDQLRGEKPCLKILNKIDLADESLAAQWQSALEQESGIKTLTFSQHKPNPSKILELCHQMVGHKERYQVMIAGIPNVGKSTLINILAGRTIAKTGNEPAVTKGQQRIRVDERMTLLDTPGMLWPNIENEDSGYRLAVTGGIKETAFEIPDIAFYAAVYLLNTYPEALTARYQLEAAPESANDFFEAAGKMRGCLRSGGVVDLERIGKIFLTELRAGQIGRITLETPAMREQELIKVEEKRAAKEAKKKAREEAKQAKRAKTKKNRR